MDRRRNANARKLLHLHVFVFLKCKFETFLMTVKAMCLRIQVAELNTLSVEKELHAYLGRFLMRWKIQMKTQIYVN